MEQEEKKNERKEEEEEEEENRTLLLNCAYPETSLLQLLSTWRQAPPPPHCARLNQKNWAGHQWLRGQGRRIRSGRRDWSEVFQR